MLDTNVLSDVVRNPQGNAAGRIVAAELWYGVAKKGSPRLTAQLGAILDAIDVLALESPVEQVYADLRARLERQGQPIGGNDLLIAAQSIALGFTLVTDNERELSRIPELARENWLR